MGRGTPRSRIRGMLRRIFLRSNERANALKETNYCCSRCGIKQTAKKGQEVKIHVHHDEQVEDVMNELIDKIQEKLLCVYEPEKLEPLCKECHDKETYF